MSAVAALAAALLRAARNVRRGERANERTRGVNVGGIEDGKVAALDSLEKPRDVTGPPMEEEALVSARDAENSGSAS